MKIKRIMYLILLNCMIIKSYAITADSAEKKCRKYLAETTCADDHPSIKELKKIENLIIMLLNKIKSADVQIIPQLLYDCMSGVDALKWLGDHSQKEELETSTDLVSFAPPKENK